MPGPKIVELPAAPADDTKFIKTLVWALDEARKGRIRGYAFVFNVENDERRRLIECAWVPEDDDGSKTDEATELLGAIRRMELSYIKRAWPEE
jgi:hypothetical protein